MWNDPGSIDPRVVPDLLRICKRWNIYHLTLEAADLAQQVGQRVPDDVAGEVVEELETWLEGGALLNTMILEAISSYKPLEITSVERAMAEIRNLLTRQPDPESNAKAVGIFYLQFEEVFEGVYYQAIEELSESESVELHLRAALGIDRDAFFVTSLLLRLLERSAAEAKPAFERWVRPPGKTSLYSDTPGGAFLLAHLGLARLGAALPEETPVDADEAAWREWGKILYWMHRADLSEAERTAQCQRPWERLTRELVRAAIDPWYWITRYRESWSRLEPLGFLLISEVFRCELKALLEEGLRSSEGLTSLFDHFRVEERVRMVIGELGVIGDETTAVMLEGWCDSEDYGEEAVKAVRAIRGESRD